MNREKIYLYPGQDLLVLDLEINSGTINDSDCIHIYLTGNMTWQHFLYIFGLDNMTAFETTFA